ncbi:branched-chain amino acid aminotransferase [Nocardia sp. NBC_01499]|uniref:branched-chain amino acid aminotransferase n=1 Tax=Nocardia sp. NBC_01499 TaxID=2903597 RepID=UPI003868FD6A
MSASDLWTRDMLAPVGRLPTEQVRQLSESADFGTTVTEHMVMLNWSAEQGWHDGIVCPFGDLTINPVMSGLHNGQVVFEGLKVFRQSDGGLAGFRVVDHSRRLAASAHRLALPALPEDLFIASISELLQVDERWIPNGEDRSLYVRPTIFGTESTLALRPARTCTYLLLAFPTSAFFGQKAGSIAVWATTDYSRAAPGGTGEAKCAGNYAAGFIAQQQALAHDCQQVLWLDAAEKRWIEEMGGMNVFWMDAGALVTPPLSGTLLRGITRDSILALAARMGIPVEQRRVSLGEFCQRVAAGKITEVFACGTAAVIAPIGRIATTDGDLSIGGGPVTTRLRKVLTDIQYGRAADTEGWMFPFRW